MDEHCHQNDRTAGIECPKCGQISKNQGVCGACGAVFGMMREPEVPAPGEETPQEEDTAPAHTRPRVATIVGISLSVLALVCIAFVYIVRSGNLEKIIHPKRDLPEEYEVPEGFRGVVLVFLSRSAPDSVAQAATIAELGREYRGQLAFVRLDLKEDEVIARRLRVGDEPSVLLFDRRRRLKTRLPASASKQILKETVERCL